jgi:hypothetical protein
MNMDYQERQWVENSSVLLGNGIIYVSKVIASIEFEIELPIHGIEYAMQISWKDNLYNQPFLVNAVISLTKEASKKYPYRNHKFGGIGMVDCVRAINRRVPSVVCSRLDTKDERAKFNNAWMEVRQHFAVFEANISY